MSKTISRNFQKYQHFEKLLKHNPSKHLIKVSEPLNFLQQVILLEIQNLIFNSYYNDATNHYGNKVKLI